MDSCFSTNKLKGKLKKPSGIYGAGQHLHIFYVRTLNSYGYFSEILSVDFSL